MKNKIDLSVSENAFFIMHGKTFDQFAKEIRSDCDNNDETEKADRIVNDYIKSNIKSISDNMNWNKIV